MRSDKSDAIRLRREGYSYKKIRERLRVPSSTLSGWFSNEEWSKELKERLTKKANQENVVKMRELNKVRGGHLNTLYEEAKNEAKEEFKRLKYDPLFIAGIMLYWGEGDKVTRGKVRLANSDPALVRVYTEFLRKTCRVPEEKIRASILIYPDINEASNKRFWSFATNIPANRFTKSTTIKGRHKTKKLEYGVCTVYVSSAYLKTKVLIWLTLLSKALLEEG